LAFFESVNVNNVVSAILHLPTRRSYFGVLFSTSALTAMSAFRIGSADIISTTVVRDLGTYLDADLSMWSHVQQTVAGCLAIL